MTATPARVPTLTNRQRTILRLIREHDAVFHEGPAPSLLARRLEISVHAVIHHVAALVRKGLVAQIYSPLTLTPAGRDYPLLD